MKWQSSKDYMDLRPLRDEVLNASPARKNFSRPKPDG